MKVKDLKDLKTSTINVKVTAIEKAEIELEAMNGRKSLSQFVRSRILKPLN